MTTNNFNMANKNTILILGASGGIGTAIAQILNTFQHQLILHGTKKSDLDQLISHLDISNSEIFGRHADFTDISELTSFVSKIKNEYQQIDWIIIANGYIDENENKGKISYESIQKTFNVNTIAPAFIIQELSSSLTETGGIIAISSTASLSGNPGFPIYSASKGALNVLMKSYAKEFTSTERKVITICPGGTNTKMRERVAADANKKQSPNVIADCIVGIINKGSDFANDDIIVINDGTVEKLNI